MKQPKTTNEREGTGMSNQQEDIRELTRQLHKLETELTVIKSDNVKIYEILDKINSALEKLTEYYNKISMENYATSGRIAQVEKLEQVFTREMQRYMEATQAHIVKLEDKIQFLERWVWIVSGGGAVVGFLISNLVKLI